MNHFDCCISEISLLMRFRSGCVGVVFNQPLDVVVRNFYCANFLDCEFLAQAARVRNSIPPERHRYPPEVLRDIWIKVC